MTLFLRRDTGEKSETMGYGIKLEVWGEYALFKKPESGADFVSYEVMTPPAARGIIEAIYWKPAIRYTIDKIYVLNPIAYADRMIGNRKLTVLKDVHYIIQAHFDLLEHDDRAETAQKHYAILMRNINMGRFHRKPYFGYREFPVSFRPWKTGEEINTAYPKEMKDLGYMLYDMDFTDPAEIRPMIFKAVLKNGVLNLDTVGVF